jgi:hypothetical protein
MDKYVTCPDCHGHKEHSWYKFLGYDRSGLKTPFKETVPCTTCKETGKIEESDFIIMKLSGKF